MMGATNDGPKDFIQLAADAAAGLAKEYDGQPEMEFLAWLRIALEREAMVSAAYSSTFVDGQLARWQHDLGVPRDIVSAVRTAIESVWAQETAHQQLFKAVLFSVYRERTLLGRLRNELKRAMGYIDGSILAGLTSPNPVIRHFARIVTQVGRYLADVPEYVQRLRDTRFPQFCLINADLESTAVSGYERMLELATSLRDANQIAYTTLIQDITRTSHDERYHEALFRSLADWPPPAPGSAGPTGVPPRTGASLPTETLTALRTLIETAQARAYGATDRALGEHPMDVDEDAIRQDPLVIYLQEFVERDTEVATRDVLYAAADTGEAPVTSTSARGDEIAADETQDASTTKSASKMKAEV